MASRHVMVVRRSFTPRDQLRNRLTGKLKVLFEAKGYVHVGSGSPAFKGAPRSEAEAVVRRLLETGRPPSEATAVGPEPLGIVRYGDRPCIPGSTIKGLLRARLELGAKEYGGRIDSCLSVSGPPLRTLPGRGSHGWRHLEIWGTTVAQSWRERCDPLSTGSYDLCVVCDLFGAPGVSARVMPENLCLERGEVKVLSLPYGERIEALSPGSVLSGYVAFTGLRLEEFGLLLLAIGMHRGGGSVPLLVGRHKYAYKGMGVAYLKALKAEFLAETLGRLEEAVASCSREDGLVRCSDGPFKDLVYKAISAALDSYRSWRDFERFSEAQKRDEKDVSKEVI